MHATEETYAYGKRYRWIRLWFQGLGQTLNPKPATLTGAAGFGHSVSLRVNMCFDVLFTYSVLSDMCSCMHVNACISLALALSVCLCCVWCV